MRLTIGLWVVVMCPAIVAAQAPDDAELGKLKENGVKLTATKGVLTAATVADGKKLTDADFATLGRLAHLKSLDVNNGLNDERLARLAGLAELEYLQTNAAQITDDGLKSLAKLKKLKNLKFFHPGPLFSGKGLVHLAELPELQQLTVAGSLAFNDEGMAAVAKLSKLQEFRTWHAGGTNEGVKKLKELSNLKSLNLGQCLTYKPPACPNDETVGILAEMKSLEVLQLSEARLGLAALEQLKQLPALKKLTLEGIDLPKASVEQLEKELPKVKIVWTEPSEIYKKRIRSLFGEK